ncbi:MAG: hypothetical protein ABI240_15310 [Sphingomonas sp.]
MKSALEIPVLEDLQHHPLERDAASAAQTHHLFAIAFEQCFDKVVLPGRAAVPV